jgi:hypothetical protein
MTDKIALTDSQGPGVREAQAKRRRWKMFQGAYVVAATALTVGLVTGTRNPALGLPRFTPEAALAGAVLLPLLTLVTMLVTLRMSDEVQRRHIVDAWAVGLIVIMFGCISWLFLIGGALLPEPPGPAALIAVIGGGGLAVVVAAIWLQWRRS